MTVPDAPETPRPRHPSSQHAAQAVPHPMPAPQRPSGRAARARRGLPRRSWPAHATGSAAARTALSRRCRPAQALPTSQQIGLAPQFARPAASAASQRHQPTTDETIGGQALGLRLGPRRRRAAQRHAGPEHAGRQGGRRATSTQYQPVPLGFTPLDKTIGGGIRAGEMLLIGGAQGTGKTTMAVQMARNIVMSGLASVLYICFEHDEEYLLNRIIAQESVLPSLPNRAGGVKLVDVRQEILGTWMATGGQNADLGANPRLRPALERVNRYGPNLYLLRGSQTTSTVENMSALVQRYKELSGDRRLVVFIDYMQKVPVHPEPPNEAEKVTYVVQGLKDLALNHEVPLISIVAADKEGLKAVAPAQPPPARLVGHQLRGRHHPHPQREVPDRGQGEHRVQPVPGAALPRLGGGHRREEPRRHRTPSTWSTRSTSSTPASTPTAARSWRSSSRSASTTTRARRRPLTSARARNRLTVGLRAPAQGAR